MSQDTQQNKWDWERHQGKNEHNGYEWDDVCIADGPSMSIITGRHSISVAVADLDEFIAFLQDVKATVSR